MLGCPAEGPRAPAWRDGVRRAFPGVSRCFSLGHCSGADGRCLTFYSVTKPVRSFSVNFPCEFPPAPAKFSLGAGNFCAKPPLFFAVGVFSPAPLIPLTRHLLPSPHPPNTNGTQIGAPRSRASLGHPPARGLSTRIASLQLASFFGQFRGRVPAAPRDPTFPYDL